MKQLDEMERMAREAVDWREIDTGEPEWAREERLNLARALLAVMPVVRAAERLNANYRDTSGSMSRIDAIEDGVREVSDAIDELRRRLGGE